MQKKKVSPKKEFAKLALYLFIDYLLLLAVMYTPIYSKIVLHPEIKPEGEDNKLYKLVQLRDAPRKEYFFDSKGDKLHGWLFDKPGSKTLIVVHHGNAGNIINQLILAKVCVKAGASVFIYDYRGFGKSTGQASLSGLLDDGLAAYDFTKAAFHYPKTINYGQSIGSAVACYVDSKRKSDGLILEAGIASLPSVAKDGIIFLNLYPYWMWPEPKFNNCLLLSKSNTPLLLMHGECDKLSPIHNSDLLYKAAHTKEKTLVRLPHCEHSDMAFTDADLFQAAITKYIQQVATSCDP